MSKNRLRRTAQIIICKRFHYCRATQLVCNFMLCNHQKYSTFVTFDPTQSNSSKTAKSRPNPTRGSTQPMDNSDVATICWRKYDDMLSSFVMVGGVGISQLVVNSLVGVYYNMIIAWSLFYLFSSFINITQLPWRHCHNDWNTYRQFAIVVTIHKLVQFVIIMYLYDLVFVRVLNKYRF